MVGNARENIVAIRDDSICNGGNLH